MEEKGNRAKKKDFGVRYRVSEQTDSGSLLCPPAQNRKGAGGAGKRGTTSVTRGHLATALLWPPRQSPSWGRAGGQEAQKGAAACGLCFQPCCTGELAFPSAQKAGRESEDIREAPAVAGHSHRPVPELGGDLCRVSGGGCSLRCSCWFCPILSPLQAFSSIRVWVSKRYQPRMVSPALLFIQSLLGQPDFQKSRGGVSDSRRYNLRARPVSPWPSTAPSSPGCSA